MKRITTEKHNFIFGVFNNGKLVFAFNKARCSHALASLIVGILDMGKGCLREGDYFACDYEAEGDRWKN